ncbi:unnamed protein product [Gadus morhua 'NCC']
MSRRGGQSKTRLGRPRKAFPCRAVQHHFSWSRALPEVYECSHFFLNQPCRASTPLHVPADNPLPNVPDYTAVNREHVVYGNKSDRSKVKDAVNFDRTAMANLITVALAQTINKTECKA